MTKRAVSAPDTTRVQLRRPLGTLRELVLKRPTAAEFRPLPMRVLRPNESGKATGATWGDMLSVVAGCSGIPLDTLQGLSSRDAVAAVNAVNAFFVNVKDSKARTKKRADGGVTLELSRPLQLGSEKLERLEWKPCTAAEMMDLPVEPSIDDLLNFASRLTLQPAPILDRLDVEDTLPVIEIASRFFADSRETGD